MQIPNFPAIQALRPAWSKVRIVGRKRPLKPKHVWAIHVRFELAVNQRDLALFNMIIDGKLRGFDLVCMKGDGVMASGQIFADFNMIFARTRLPISGFISDMLRAGGDASPALQASFV